MAIYTVCVGQAIKLCYSESFLSSIVPVSRAHDGLIHAMPTRLGPSAQNMRALTQGERQQFWNMMGKAAQDTADYIRRTEILESKVEALETSLGEEQRERANQLDAQMAVTEQLTTQVQDTRNTLQQHGVRLDAHAQYVKQVEGVAKKSQSTLKRFFSVMQAGSSDDDDMLDDLDLDDLERNAYRQCQSNATASSTEREAQGNVEGSEEGSVLRHFSVMHNMKTTTDPQKLDCALLLSDLDIDTLQEADILAWRAALKQNKTPHNVPLTTRNRTISKVSKEPYIAATSCMKTKKWKYAVFCDRWSDNHNSVRKRARKAWPMLYRFKAAFHDVRSAVLYRDYVLQKLHAEIELYTLGGNTSCNLVFR